MDWSAQQAKYGSLVQPRQAAAVPAQGGGGLTGFLTSAAKGIAHPFGYLLDTAIGNPTRELAASLTHNDTAYKNATDRTNKTLGLGDNGTDIGNATKRLAGNGAQAILGTVAPGGGVLKDAALGAGYGASSALAQDGSTADDVLGGALTGGVTGGVLGAGGKILGKLTGAGNELEKGVINPKVTPGVFGAAQEDAITNAAKEVPGLSAKTKYANLGGEMNKLTSQIDDHLSTIKDTIPKDEFIARLKSEALDNANYLDSTNPQHLSTLESQISRFTKNLPEDMSAKDVFQVKKDLGSAIGKGFDKLSSGEATNALKQAQYDLWTQMDKRITDMAPGVKELTTQQSNLIKSAAGLKASANKAIGVPLLGVKSKLAEQGLQSGMSAAGKAADFVGSLPGSGVLNKIVSTAATTQQPKTPVQPTTDTTFNPLVDNTADASGAPTAQAGQSSPIFNSNTIQKLVLEDMAKNGGKNVPTLLSLYNTFGKPAALTSAQQTASTQISDAASLLDDMQSQLQQAGGGRGRLGGILSNLEGKVGLNNGVNAFNQTKTDAAIALSKALSGSTRLPPPATLKLLEDSMPSITDNPEEAARKVAIIKERLQSKQQNIQIAQ